ncbi:hypothetical protein F4703DRAFT_1954813 [Phycomyces blakesleeanus]
MSLYNSVYLGHGRKTVYTAVCGFDKDIHLIIRCSTKEYYHYTWSAKFLADQQKLKKENGIDKSAEANRYYDYVKYMLEHIDSLFDFYNVSSGKKWLTLYQNQYSRDGMFGKDSVKLKGNLCGVTGILWKTLNNRERDGRLIAVTIDKYNYSNNRSSCHLKKLKPLEHICGHSILEFISCRISWQRDINASKNMMTISLRLGEELVDRPLSKDLKKKQQ